MKNFPSRERGRQAGFTLLELMLWLRILTVGVMAAFTGQVNSLALISSSDETRIAVVDLSSAMETLVAQGPDNSVDLYPAGQPLPMFDSLHLSDQQIVPNYLNFTGGALPEILDVELICSWSDFQGRDRSLRLVSAIGR